MFDQEKLKTLVELREAAEISQDEAGRLLGLEGTHRRNSVRDWEKGLARPGNRDRFIFYLRDNLGIDDPEEFQSIWQNIMVVEWDWRPLDAQEWKRYFKVVRKIEATQAGLVEFIYLGEEIEKPFMAPNLPQQTIIGRQRQMNEIKQIILKGNDIALLGLPGVGKSTLATLLAHDKEIIGNFPDGVLWSGVGRNGNVYSELGYLGEQLGVHAISEYQSIKDRAAKIKQKIGQKRLLIVIDDVWQLEDALNLRIGGANCVHLLTTRRPEIAIRFSIENVYEVKELTEGKGLELLINLVPKLQESKIAYDLVRAVGALPLGLILLGNYLRLKMISVLDDQSWGNLLIEIQKKEKLLALQREQAVLRNYPSLDVDTPISLIAVIQISDEALDSKSRQLLYALSVFLPKPNHFSRDAALFISDSDETHFDILCNSGLIEAINDERVALHQTIADYAKVHLTNHHVYQNTVHYFTDFVERYKNHYEIIEQEQNNIIESLKIASSTNMGSKLIKGLNALFQYLATKGFYQLAQELIEMSEPFLIEDEPSANVLLYQGNVFDRFGNYELADKSINKAISIAEKLETPNRLSLISKAHSSLASVAFKHEDWDTCERVFNYSLQLAHEINDYEQVARNLTNIGTIYFYRGDYRTAEKYHKKALPFAKEINKPENLSDLLMNLGAALSKQKDRHQEALIFHEQALELAQTLDYRENIAYILLNMGAIANSLGKHKEAIKNHSESYEVAMTIDYKEVVAGSLMGLGEAYIGLGKPKEAQKYIVDAERVAKAINHRWLLLSIKSNWGEIFLVKEEFNLARKMYSEVEKEASELGAYDMIAVAWFGQGRVAQGLGDVEQAKVLGKKSLELFVEQEDYWEDKVRDWLNSLEASGSHGISSDC